jgi:hypothetical protein
MAGHRSFPLRGTAALLLAMSLAACALMDDFSGRAVTYNAEASSQRSSTILMNIKRAAYRLPLQFSDVTSVTGTASIGGELGAEVPSGGSPIFTPKALASGGPTFSVAALNTQEFYQGLQTPLDAKIVANLLAQGYRRDVLFPLIISDVVIEDATGRRMISMEMTTIEQCTASTESIRALIDAGLFVDRITIPEVIGPKLSDHDARRLMPDLVRAQADALSGNEVATITSATSAGGFNLSRESKQFRFCFDPLRSVLRNEHYAKYNMILPNAYDGRVDLVVDEDNIPYRQFSFVVPPHLFCGSKLKKTPGGTSITFVPRSTAGIYNYLGALARLNLGLDGRPPAVLQFAEDKQRTRFFTLLNLQRGAPPQNGISTGRGFDSIYITPDPTGRDASSEVMQILTDLQSLLSKASSLPAAAPVAILTR